MTSNKSKAFKDFIIETRKSLKSNVSVAPVWIMQKAGKRIWNSKQKRKWTDIQMGRLFKKKNLKITQQKLRKTSKKSSVKYIAKAKKKPFYEKIKPKLLKPKKKSE